jgi:hypothetical protein
MDDKKKILTKRAIRAFQQSWADGVLSIGRAYRENRDYRSLAAAFIKKHYGYGEGLVLFKPTLASVEQFRETFDKALSYFIGGNPECPEDKGFALSPWTKIRFENAGIIIIGNHAVAMGNYYFTDPDGKEEKVEYTFGYFIGPDGEIRMNLHHSSIPYPASRH